MQNENALWASKNQPHWTDRFRDPFSGLSHLAAAGLSLIGLIILLVLGWGDLAKETSLFVYGLSLILMFSASATYHLANIEPVKLLILRKMDHSAIFLLIAGSYTPICLYFFEGFFRWGLLILVWAIALVGISIKIFVIKAPRWITAGIYLLMGWLAILAIGQMITNMPAAAIAWLIVGGLFYSGGAIVYITKKPDFIPGVFGFHEFWHIFVILGALSHYILIAAFIAAK